jgi:hypothetical protein
MTEGLDWDHSVNMDRTGTESMPENNLERSSTGGLDEDGVLCAKARCCAEG